VFFWLARKNAAGGHKSGNGREKQPELNQLRHGGVSIAPTPLGQRIALSRLPQQPQKLGDIHRNP